MGELRKESFELFPRDPSSLAFTQLGCAPFVTRLPSSLVALLVSSSPFPHPPGRSSNLIRCLKLISSFHLVARQMSVAFIRRYYKKKKKKFGGTCLTSLDAHLYFFASLKISQHFLTQNSTNAHGETAVSLRDLGNVIA